jgi:hypothetical protein
MDSILSRLRALLIQEDHPSRAGRFAINVLRLIYFATSEFRRSRCPQRALELAYATLFTLVPVTTLFLLISRTAGSLDRWIQDGRRFIINLTIGALPPEDAEAIDGFIDTAFTAVSRGLETSSALTSGASFLVLVAFSIALLLLIENVFNSMFGVRRRRNLIARVTVFWTVLTLSPLLLAGSMYMRSQIVEMLVAHNLERLLRARLLRSLFQDALHAGPRGRRRGWCGHRLRSLGGGEERCLLVRGRERHLQEHLRHPGHHPDLPPLSLRDVGDHPLRR